MTFLLHSEVATDAARELSVRLLGLGQISGLLEPLARLQQVCRQIGPADVDAEAIDHARPCDDGSAGLPKSAQLVWARLDLTLSDEP